ncbi:hypothetical protein GCK72_018316 [Caenorhabditis remanei]|uniref:Major sperm protein n=1 Tax=Caenorhabditis remanei TaxID=31234 RepID=A0A6A5GBF8_CAERE|nr:hypothetical protein GCK72_018316 [Caenorhabditis remanei]KAF1751762.1 hypothetical protein GCK72_018316 [Caenorhabditis remanei]
MANADLSKVSFNPSTSITFTLVERRQKAKLEVINNSKTTVMIKFKNTNPTVFKITPLDNCKIKPGEKQDYQCIFKGATKEMMEKSGKLIGQRFTLVVTAISANANTDTVKKQAFKSANLKHKIQILFAGINDQKEKEAPQPTNNDDVEDKDREGKMRSKGKSEPPKVKRANVVMFMRKEGESISDEDDDEGGATAPAAQAPNDDMMTTRPAGNFTGQVVSSANTAANPNSEFRTTRPAGNFTGQVASNATPGAPVDPKSSELRTTRPAGAFNGQVTPNAASAADEKDDFKTTKDAGPFENLQKNNKK